MRFAVFGGILTLAFGFGYLLTPSIQVNNLRTLLSVMIGSQASVLAIVISVTLISTQLVATRYAPRMATLPFRTPLFKGAFLLFAISIILDALLLMGVTGSTSPLYSGLLFVAVGLFFGVLLFLYFFVRGMVAQSSPENLVTLFTETVSSEEYLDQSEDLADAPEQNAHPLQPLYRFIMAALSRNEYATARAALDQYQQYASRIMSEFDEQGVFEDDSVDCKRELFGPVLEEQLHLITIHAAEKDESQILSSAVSTQVSLGKQGMDLERSRLVPGDALSGLRSTIIETPVSADDYVTSNNAWKGVGELILEESDYDQHRVLLSGKNLIRGRLGRTLQQSSEPGWHADAFRELFTDLCKAHTNVIEKIADGPGFEETDLNQDPTRADMPASDFVEQARFSRDAILEATSTFLKFRVNQEFWPVTEGNFRHEWRDLCIAVSENGAEDHAVQLCQALIEMGFIENLNRPYDNPQDTSYLFDSGSDSDYVYWARELESIREETANPIVKQAFDKILRYEYEEGPTPIRFAGETDEVEEQYYFPILSWQEDGALNTYSEFPGLIEELRERSIEE